VPATHVVSIRLTDEDLSKLDVLRVTPNGIITRPETIRQSIYEFIERRKGTM
jgi:hypothetical protein